MWIQVKGTRRLASYLRSANTYGYLVPVRHAIRWLRSADPVVVVLWDVIKDTGRFAVVGDGENLWDKTDAATKTLPLRISDDAVFDRQAVDHLAWLSRIERYQGLLLQAKAAADDRIGEAEDAELPPGQADLLAMDFLQTLGIVGSRRGRDVLWLEPRFSAMLAEHLADPRGEGLPREERFYVATVTALLDWTEKLSGEGLSLAVIEPTVRVLIATLKASSPQLATLLGDIA
jgi:hypothetical protein